MSASHALHRLLRVKSTRNFHESSDAEGVKYVNDPSLNWYFQKIMQKQKLNPAAADTAKLIRKANSEKEERRLNREMVDLAYN